MGLHPMICFEWAVRCKPDCTVRLEMPLKVSGLSISDPLQPFGGHQVRA